MIGPTLAQALRWRPEALRLLADAWDDAARDIHHHVTAASRLGRDSEETWQGASGAAARQDARSFQSAGDVVARALVCAAVAARDGAGQLAEAASDLATRVAAARTEGFDVGDDGTVRPDAAPTTLLLLLSGNDVDVAHRMLTARAEELTRQIAEALRRLHDADDDAARDIGEAFESVQHGDEGRDGHADHVGNTDGVPWNERIAANRTNVAQAIVERLEDGAEVDFYRGLLAEVDDPAGGGERIDRKILAFDPARQSLIELNGDLRTADSVAVLVPGMNTTIAGSAADTRRARQFVAATRGEVAAITYLGGPFPQDDSMLVALAEAASPRFAVAMAPRLVAFSQGVEDAVDATGRAIPVTYIGHSYGGSILGTAEAMGLTADRTLYAAAAGAGVGVDEPQDWHDRNPHVLRFSMTAPGDPIQFVQGLPGGPHGADPDEMSGVIHLATGNYDDGRPMAGVRAHTDLLDIPASDAWRNVLAVITGDRDAISLSG